MLEKNPIYLNLFIIYLTHKKEKYTFMKDKLKDTGSGKGA